MIKSHYYKTDFIDWNSIVLFIKNKNDNNNIEIYSNNQRWNWNNWFFLDQNEFDCESLRQKVCVCVCFLNVKEYVKNFFDPIKKMLNKVFIY